MTDLGTIGFIGLGNMGGPMAANLARAGVPLVVRDADAERQADFVERFGAAAGDDPAAFGEVSAVLTMLPNGRIVQSALLESTIADHLPTGTLVLDTSSSDPLETLELGRSLSARGLRLVDAPVSGGMVKAIDGTLSIMLGADDDETAALAERVLAPVSARVFRTGALGTGHAMKALNNFVLGAGFVAAAEALIVGEKFGLDPEVILGVLNASSGRNVSTETTIVEEVLTGRFAANFTLALFSKDLGIAANLARSLGADAPLSDLTHRRLADAAAALGPSTDYTRVVPFWAAASDSSAQEA